MIISITGKPCSGKSTISKILQDKYGFKIISVGELFKAEASKLGMSSEEFNKYLISHPGYDKFIDDRTVELGKKLKNDNVIFDSRLAWYFIPNSFKIFLDLDEEEMGKRLSKSDRKGKEKIDNPKEAAQSLLSRFKFENERYNLLYGFDNTNMNNYNLVLDSKDKTPDELAEQIMVEYKKYFNLN